jgi:pyruvate,water dikinase
MMDLQSQNQLSTNQSNSTNTEHTSHANNLTQANGQASSYTSSAISDLILPLAGLHRDQLALVGGKAANLGEMISAGLPVPPGFCVTTHAYARVAADAGLDTLLAEAQTLENNALAEAARTRLLNTQLPPKITAALLQAYQQLGDTTPVAVRSSATAEDLPGASFAGQQDTYLNIVGPDALLDAVLRCFASLWSDRAVSYRSSLKIDQRTVRLAVVVQTMVDSTVAGVLFTANPLTGKRRQAVIDANPGLGEAVVSGASNPDHFVVNSTTGEIVERHLGDKKLVISSLAGGGTSHTENQTTSDIACLTDEQVQAVAQLGVQVEHYYGTPQDIEWAIDADNKLWLVQSRPITTLYPLPANAPTTDDDLRVYFSFNVIQGVYGPITPTGRSAIQLFMGTVATFMGLGPRNPWDGPAIYAEAGERIYADLTRVIRSEFGRRLFQGAASIGEARSVELIEQLGKDPRLAPLPKQRLRFWRTLATFSLNTHLPITVLRAIINPKGTQKRIQKFRKHLEVLTAAEYETDAVAHLKQFEQDFPHEARHMLKNIVPMIPAGLGSHAFATHLLGKDASPADMQIVLRGLPHNPTTEMDLELWAMTQRIKADAPTAQFVRETPIAQITQGYLSGSLPALLQSELKNFLRCYGHRAVAEIDMGVTRWSEDPTHIIGVLANYLRLEDAIASPDVQFERGVREAEAMVAELTKRARQKSWLRGKLVGFFLSRVRALVGFREMPKYCIVLLLAHLRKLLLAVGKQLEASGQLENAHDVIFLSDPEVHRVLAGEDLRPLVRERRASYEREMSRRHIPRLLLSDGTEPSPIPTGEAAAHLLTGAPASPGQITAIARVILNPNGAHLEPGEILVAPSTDPGWTPLFLTAGGLVMEMGGMLSHGAVVAREYGIPAVVGVPAATERIANGQRITIDGTAGTITLEEEQGEGQEVATEKVPD